MHSLASGVLVSNIWPAFGRVLQKHDNLAIVAAMPFTPLPESAAWQHAVARSGFEVVFFHATDDGWHIEGSTTAIEDNHAWIVDYVLDVDSTWTTRSAQITGRSIAGLRSTVLTSDGAGHWMVDDKPAPHLDGCLDVDLESSAMTNTLPVHRLNLSGGVRASAPAAYVRALDLTVEQLEQSYLRTSDRTYDYAAPVFDFACRLVYDDSGLILDYPGIATRVS